jgi:hypothetical protein
MATLDKFRVEAFIPSTGEWMILTHATTLEGANATALEWSTRRGFVVQIVPNTDGAHS